MITIHWTLLLPGMLLVLFPADRLLSAKVKLRTLESFRSLDDSPHDRPWWWVPTLWLDPVRAAAGTWMLLKALDLDTMGLAPVSTMPIALAAGLLGPAVILQCGTARDPESLLAPIGFLSGLAAVLLPLAVALPGVAAALLAMLAFRHFHIFFSVGAAAVVLLGLILQTEPWRLAVGGGAFVLPLLVVFATKRTLELPARVITATHRG